MISNTLKETTKSSGVFEQVTDLGHEQVVYCYDQETSLKAIVAIHNTVLGPAMGGTRMWDYATEHEATTDVLRLSRGMTFKAAIAGLNIGGGKAVIIGDARKLKNEALMRRFGRFINSLGGKYVTAEDVNMTTEDMQYVRLETKYVAGTPKTMGGSGDPSPVTAYGVYVGMKAAYKKLSGSDSLTGKSVLIQGAGNVGTNLAEYLIKEGAKVSVSDIFEDKIKKITNTCKVNVVPPDKIFEQEMDIYAPCALGGTLNDESIPQMKFAVIAGGANNQLLDEDRHGNMLRDKGIIYAPDFLINGGGIINVCYDYLGIHSEDLVMKQTEKIYDTCLSVLQQADEKELTPQETAMKIATKRIKEAGGIKWPL